MLPFRYGYIISDFFTGYSMLYRNNLFLTEYGSYSPLVS